MGKGRIKRILRLCRLEFFDKGEGRHKRIQAVSPSFIWKRERCVGNKHTKLEENTQNRFVPLSKEAQVNSKKETNKGLSVQATNMVKVFQNKV